MKNGGSEPRLDSGLSTVTTALGEVDAAAVGFVHVGGRSDPDRRYLTRLDGPDRETAVVVIAGDADRHPQAVYCVPAAVVDDVRQFEQTDSNGLDRTVSGRPPSVPTGQQVQNRLADRLGEAAGTGTLLVARDLPHDTAVVLQQAGYTLQSTAAVRTARASKTPAERDCLVAVQTAAAAGIGRAETVLAQSNVDDNGVIFEGQPLSADRLRRLIDTELVDAGVSPAANTAVHSMATGLAEPLSAGVPIRLTVAPRGLHGYYGFLTRTMVVDSDGGWERRAHIAAEAGLTAARRHLEVGVDISTVEGETLAEIGAYGFAVTESTQSRATATAHGVGLSTYEQPAPGGLSKLDVGSTVAISAGVDDSQRGTVQVGTLFVVTETGVETLVEHPSSLSPVERPAVDD